MLRGSRADAIDGLGDDDRESEDGSGADRGLGKEGDGEGLRRVRLISGELWLKWRGRWYVTSSSPASLRFLFSLRMRWLMNSLTAVQL